MISIRIHGELLEKTGRKQGEWQIPYTEGISVGDIIHREKIPDLEVGIIIVNNGAAQRSTTVKKGDVIDLIIESLDDDTISHVKDELADIFIYLLRLSDKLNIDLESAVRNKIKINSDKYPVNISYNSAVKYNRRKR